MYNNTPSTEIPRGADGKQLPFCMGINWESVKKGIIFKSTVPVDLDAMALLYDGGRALRETVAFLNPRSSDRAVQLMGDDQVGDKDGLDYNDNETIRFNLAQINPKVQFIALLVSRWDGGSLEDVPSATMRAYTNEHSKGAQNIIEYTIRNDYAMKGARFMVLGVLKRSGDRWFFSPEGQWLDNSSIKQVFEDIRTDFIK